MDGISSDITSGPRFQPSTCLSRSCSRADPSRSRHKLPRRMQKIEMRAQFGRADRARHAVARFEKRPIERFSVEGDEHAAFRNPFRERHKHRMLLAVLAHEKLLDFKSARVPPGNAHHERIRSRSAREARRFRIEEKPLLRVCDIIRRFRSKQPKRCGIESAVGWLAADGFRKPLPQCKVLARAIALHRRAENLREPRRALRNVG